MFILRPNTIYLSILLLILVIIGLFHYSPSTSFGFSSSRIPLPEDVPAHLLELKLPTEYSSFYPTLLLPPTLLNHPKLYTRLHAFLSRPVRSYADGVADNEQKCPRELSDRLVNPDQLEGDGDFWRNDVQEDEIRKRRVEMVEYLVKVMESGEKVVWEVAKPESEQIDQAEKEEKEAERIEEEQEKQAEEATKDLAEAMIETPDYAKRSPIPSSDPLNRGIVTTGGNSDTMTRLVTLMRILRNHQSVTLPCEIWAFPHELDSNSWEYKELTTSLSCVVREAPGLEKDTGAWKNFQIKGLAIASSSFKEIIYLDSDNIPLRDPTYLFESEKYLEEGGGKAVFWPDLSRDHVDNAIWRLMGIDCDMEDFTLESGQIVIDKAGNDGLNLAALHLAAYMQSQHEFWFHMCGGDKDTFRWAFVALDIPFTRATRWATALGTTIPHQNNRFCGHTVLQYELDTPEGATRPRPLFVHSNLMKHISQVSPDNAFTHLKRMSRDEYFEPTLNQAHMWVYWSNGRGMCTDVELWDGGSHLTDFEKGSQFVVFETLDQVEGNPFEGFKDMFLAEGGRVGGWRKRRRDKARLGGTA